MADEFIIARVFNVPRQRVWDAWTQPDQFTRWFGPGGVTTTVKTYELQPGGLVHARMDTEGGMTLWARLLFREIEPPSRLVWLHSFSDEHGGIARALLRRQMAVGTADDRELRR